MGGDGKGGGKGGGKGKGKGKGGGGGGGGKPKTKSSAWQCRKCSNFWNGKEAVYCGSCGGKQVDCIKVNKPDPKLQAFLDENKQLRKEMDDLKKMFDRKQPQARAPQVQPKKGTGGGGHGGSGGDPSGSPPQQAAVPTSHPKAVPPSEVMVSFLEQQVSLADLMSMLEVAKPCFPESHPRIVELRSAIEQAHKLRSDNTDPHLLVLHTERNITNKQKVIDKARGKVAELRAKRIEIDDAIAEEERRIRDETVLLDKFKERLEEARSRQKLSGTQSGPLPSSLDKVPGQPALREWIRNSFPDAHTVYDASGWETPIVLEQAELFVQWRAAVGVVNGFAAYAATRTMDQIDQNESTEARRALEVIARQTKVRALVTGKARRACEQYTDGGSPTVVPFSTDCPVLREWCQSYDPLFAAVANTSERPSSSPYWKSEKPGGPIRPIVLRGDFQDEQWAQARAIIKALYGDVDSTDLPSASNTSVETEAVVQQYCTAVVENETEAAKIPKFSEFMAQFKGGVKRAGGSVESLEADAKDGK